MRDPMHCDERMELARLIPSFQVLPELLVFRCPRCGHVETEHAPAVVPSEDKVVHRHRV